MGNNKLHIIFGIVCAAVLVLIVLGLIAIIGVLDLTDGCLYRYSAGASSSDELTNTVILKANGNYTALSSDGAGRVELDPMAYGQWLNTNLRVSSQQKIKFSIKGDISLCKAYLPINNLQRGSNQDINGDLIEIPRVDDKITPPVTLYLAATTQKWRNLTEVFENDQVVVSLLPDQKTTAPSVSVYNSVQKGVITADCRAGARSYSPICGRYSVWDSSSAYTSSCQFVDHCYECNCKKKCNGSKIGGSCPGGWFQKCDWCSCYQKVAGTAPEPYADDGSFTSPWYDNLSALTTNFDRSCETEQPYINGAYQNKKYFWFSADNAAGLLYKFNDTLGISTSLGSDYEFAEIQDDQSFHTEGESYKIIMNTIYGESNIKYLQYRLYDADAYSNNTGGYVLNIKHTKCRRSNGNRFNDTVEGRGVVQYVIAGYGDNPNTNTPSTVDNILVDVNGAGEFTAPVDADGYLWLKIKNADADYKDSFGQYDVQFFTSVKRGAFYNDVLNPFFEGLKSKIQGASVTMFKNMTCYKGLGNPTDGCTNFFQYIKAILILYIMLYGMMFLMGMVKITQTDLVIRVIKIGIVAGLMNDSTFEFFNSYVFNFVTGFTDEIIANMSGYNSFSTSATFSNPFMFLDEVMTKIFLSKTFLAQITALLSMGLNGVLYFVIIFLCLCIVIMVSFKAIAVYVMAFMAIAVLIGIAPLFLTFILFERTWYLFDNWLKFMIRYMIEPVIVLAGIIILVQLFTIYLDYVIGYSVCWKCSIPFKLPFPQIEGITPAFLDVELFCINWFAPWGFDSSSGEMGMNMQNIVVLLMLAYCMWGYIEFAHKLVARLAGGSGGPSAVSMGAKMSNGALAKFGLDANSRQNMRRGMKDMAASMRRGQKLNPASSGNRMDGSGGNQNLNNTGSSVRRSNISSGALSQGEQGGAKRSAEQSKGRTWGSAAYGMAAKAYEKISGGAVTDAKASGSKKDASGTSATQSPTSSSGNNKSSTRSKLQQSSQLMTGGGQQPKDTESKTDASETDTSENKSNLNNTQQNPSSPPTNLTSKKVERSGIDSSDRGQKTEDKGAKEEKKAEDSGKSAGNKVKTDADKK